MTNYGLDLAKEIQDRTDEDWLFGSSEKDLAAKRPDGDWLDLFPPGEPQKRSPEDTMSCVTFSALKCIAVEMKRMLDEGEINPMNLRWLEDTGYIVDGHFNFSERFIAKLSNTSRRGNSLKAVAEAIRRHGLIPESELPYKEGMDWDTFMSGITDDMMVLGREFRSRFKNFYEVVSSSQFYKALEINPIQVAVHAWPSPVNGVYPRSNGPLNHASTAVMIDFLGINLSSTTPSTWVS